MLDCPLRKAGLEPREACASCTGAAPRSIGAGQVLYLEGDRGSAIFALIEGSLRESRSLPDGRTLGIRLVAPGEIVGTEALAGDAYQCTVEAMAPSRICAVPIAELRAAIDRRPGQGLRLAGALAAELERLRDAMLELGAMTADERVRSVIERFLGPPGTWMRLPLGRRDLAELLGLSPSTVSRALKQLERGGFVEVSGRNIRRR